MTKLIWAVCGVIFGTWLLGVVFKLADGAFHILALVAGALGAFNIVRMFAQRKGPATE